jgi:hypothetical protein
MNIYNANAVRTGFRIEECCSISERNVNIFALMFLLLVFRRNLRPTCSPYRIIITAHPKLHTSRNMSSVVRNSKPEVFYSDRTLSRVTEVLTGGNAKTVRSA